MTVPQMAPQMINSVATHWLPNIIKTFQKDYPNIDYELLLGDYLAKLCEECVTYTQRFNGIIRDKERWKVIIKSKTAIFSRKWRFFIMSDSICRDRLLRTYGTRQAQR